VTGPVFDVLFWLGMGFAIGAGLMLTAVAIVELLVIHRRWRRQQQQGPWRHEWPITPVDLDAERERRRHTDGGWAA
jgi:hypothetical protein